MTLDVTFQPFAFPIFARAQRLHPIRAPGSALPFRRIWHASCLITTDPTFSERDSAQETDTGTDQVRREPERPPEHDNTNFPASPTCGHQQCPCPPKHCTQPIPPPESS